MRINCNHIAKCIYFYLLPCTWNRSSHFWLRWFAVTVHGACAIVQESPHRFSADPIGHITIGRPASPDTRKHENHWNNYILQKHPSVAEGEVLHFQLLAIIFTIRIRFFSVNACAWNVSSHQMKDNTNFHISSCTSLSRGAWVQSHPRKVWYQCPRGILPLNTPKI